MYCFINQQPAILNIEYSVLLQLQKEDLHKLYIQIPQFERFFKILIQNPYIREQLRVVQTLSLSAEEWYKFFWTSIPK